MSRPTIAILCHTGQAHAVQGYQQRLREAGAHTKVVELGPQVPADALKHVDGVLVPDGDAVDFRSYSAGKPCNAANVQFDRAEIAVVDQAITRKLAVLGIGRGLRILNVAAGGVLDHAARTATSQALSILAPGFAAPALHGSGEYFEISHSKHGRLRGVNQEHKYDMAMLVSAARRS